MEPRLTGIEENEVLLYLGYKGGEIPADIMEEIHRCMDVMMKAARPRAVWRQFALLPDGAIENVLDNLCEDIGGQVEGYLTDRFSPGYGDFPFAQQPELCRVLDLPRRIGVTLSPGGLMIPQKSVTALVGVADRPQTKRFRGCAYCSQFKNCTYRKGNRTCGNQ